MAQIRTHIFRFFTLMICPMLFPGGLSATEIVDQDKAHFEGEIREDHDLSGAARSGPLLLIGSDEGSTVQVLRQTATNRFTTHKSIPLLPSSSDELDMEAIAISGEQVYVAGSHAIVREKVEFPDDDDDRTYAQNRKRLAELKFESTRQQIMRFALTPAGERGSGVDELNLRPLLTNDVYLAPFLAIPAKEGGIDIEGLAADGDLLYVGFRGPVLRENYVPVLKLQFDAPHDYELLFVNLKGYGIRDLLKVTGGFLIIAGPIGDGKGDAELYFWDGRDCVPGSDVAPAQLVKLGKLPEHSKGHAEAIALLGETASSWTLLTLYDGAAKGGARIVSVAKP